MTLTLSQMQQVARLTAVELTSLMNEKNLKSIIPDEFLSTEQAAKLLGVKKGWVNRAYYIKHEIEEYALGIYMP